MTRASKFTQFEKGKWQLDDWYIYPGCRLGKLTNKIFHKSKLWGFADSVHEAKQIVVRERAIAANVNPLCTE